jgi:oxygen-independent coproporphyrinogen-3 oxidase
MDATLTKIRKDLFHDPGDYTKNQPDLFIPHRFRTMAPSQVSAFLNQVRESIPGEDILLYVHLPFCFTECLFCNSFPFPANKAVQDEYVRNLVKEIGLFADQGIFRGKKVRGIYFGGGTPTSFPTRDLKAIIGAITSHVPLADGCGITVEAHPESLAGSRVAELAGIGVTRISMGCQSFDPEVLALCNRKNDAAQIAAIIGRAAKAGLAVNLDMMTGLPGQTIASVRRDLATIASLGSDAVEYIRHEIVNPLVVSLLRGRPELMVGKDELFEMVLLTHEWLEKNGYEQNGTFSNGSQWEYRYHWLHEMPIIAFGVRARSYTATICYDKFEDLASYARLIEKGIPPVGRYIPLTSREMMYRALFLGLQLRDGLAISVFRERFGADAREVFKPLLTCLDACGSLEPSEEAIKLSRYGAYFVEDICDTVTDAALREDSGDLVRSPHSEGSTSSRLPAR